MMSDVAREKASDAKRLLYNLIMQLMPKNSSISEWDTEEQVDSIVDNIINATIAQVNSGLNEI